MGVIEYLLKLIILIILCFLSFKKNSIEFLFEISIIILFNGNNNNVYNYISSILCSELLINYEIIIINYIPTDETTFMREKYFKNFTNIIIYDTNRKNNFISNYNKALEHSRGQYLLFLINFSKINKEKIYFLFNNIDSDQKIGMIISKLKYKNETLLKNQSNSNYSVNNYCKEIDFKSEDSIIIRKSVLKGVVGFYKTYINAFYEDNDLDLKIRNIGYKVIYQPQPVVKYYKNISNEKDVNWGIEKYQNIKENIFKNSFRRIRKLSKSRILVIDRFVPNFDQDAGGRCCFMYLNLFKQIGLKVTFLGDDLKKIEPYTTILQKRGIEVLFVDSYQEISLENWFKDNLKYFNFVYLQRPYIAIKYIDIIKKYFSGKIFYFTHDLHYIRLEREYKITHDEEKYMRSQYMKRIEIEIFNKVDIIHVVGNYESKILKERFSNKIIRNIPLYIYEKHYNDVEKDFSKRKGLIFVGGFLHRPNIDAVKWFSKDIYPKILAKYPDMILHVVGSNITEEIKQLECTNIKIEGYLSDEDLHLLYQQCRIAVVPLRFGAGVKGKIIGAAYNQVPIVTTSIGGEGLDYSLGAFIIEDNEDKMAQIINDIYLDFNKLKQMSDSGKILIDKYFSMKKAKEILLEDLL